MEDSKFNRICLGNNVFRWFWDDCLFVYAESSSSSSQRLVCVVWPDNDSQFNDRESFRDAAKHLVTESFVADAVSVALGSGWTPAQGGRDFVIQFADGAFTVVGGEPASRA